MEFPELVVSVRDADGEFLLAEAAMHIPRWLTPENSQNRAIPPSVIPEDSSAEHASLFVALRAVASTASPTLAPLAAEKAAFARLEEYPAKIDQSMHRARCKLPVLVARALALHPHLIAAAAELFYARDPPQLRACQKMDVFSPQPWAMTTVLFNRVQYAKLASQNIRPPAVFDLPPAQSSDYKASVLGMKLALNQKPALALFLESLGETSYYGSRPVTSCEYAKWRAYAERYYLESQVCGPGTPMSTDALVSLASQSLSAAVASAKADAGLSTASTTIIDDEDEDDSWLALNSDELDAMMHKAESILKEAAQGDPDQQSAGNSEYGGGGDDDALATDLQQVLGKFESFLTGSSGLEGAELVNDQSDYDEDAEGSDEDVDLDASGVIAALMKAVGADATEDDEDDVYDGNDGNDAKLTEKVSNTASCSNPNASEDAAMAATMHAMDQELSATHVGKSFILTQHAQATGDLKDDTDGVLDVNIDLNLVENIVESFRAQEGLPGPAGTFLRQFGVHLPHIDSDGDSDGDSTPFALQPTKPQK
ncbi:hypothetical protein GGI20_004655 [Coemansia sp. BCRC 34301]|nr:hypothetical protein GGI20_004655 [Coemansia sp. BCRC 34301]